MRALGRVIGFGLYWIFEATEELIGYAGWVREMRIAAKNHTPTREGWEDE